MIIQQTMFSDQAPEYEVTVNEPQSDTLVERPPGWVLVVGKSGPKGWHLIKARGSLGAVYTNCGLIGRHLPEFERLIVLCEDCLAP